MVGGGKQGRVYVVDANTMRSLQNHDGPGGDGFQGFQGFLNNYHSTSRPSCLKALDGGNSDNCGHLLMRKTCCLASAPTRKQRKAISVWAALYRFLLPVLRTLRAKHHAGFVYWPHSPAEGLLYAMPEKEHVSLQV